jgi:hypothetical protein
MKRFEEISFEINPVTAVWRRLRRDGPKTEICVVCVVCEYLPSSSVGDPLRISF